MTTNTAILATIAAFDFITKNFLVDEDYLIAAECIAVDDFFMVRIHDAENGQSIWVSTLMNEKQLITCEAATADEIEDVAQWRV